MSHIVTTDVLNRIINKAKESIAKQTESKLEEIEREVLMEKIVQKQKCLIELDNLTIYKLDQLGIDHPEIEEPRECEKMQERHNILFTHLWNKTNNLEELVQQRKDCLEKIDNLSIEKLLEMEIEIEIDTPRNCKDIIERYHQCHDKQTEQQILALGRAIEEKDQCQETVKLIKSTIENEMKNQELVINPDLTKNIKTTVWGQKKQLKKNTAPMNWLKPDKIHL